MFILFYSILYSIYIYIFYIENIWRIYSNLTKKWYWNNIIIFDQKKEKKKEVIEIKE